MAFNILDTTQATEIFQRAITRDGAHQLREELRKMESWSSPKALDLRLLLDRAKVYQDDKKALRQAKAGLVDMQDAKSSGDDLISRFEIKRAEAKSQGNLRKAETYSRAIVVLTHSFSDYRDGKFPPPVTTFVPMERITR